MWVLCKIVLLGLAQGAKGAPYLSLWRFLLFEDFVRDLQCWVLFCFSFHISMQNKRISITNNRSYWNRTENFCGWIPLDLKMFKRVNNFNFSSMNFTRKSTRMKSLRSVMRWQHWEFLISLSKNSVSKEGIRQKDIIPGFWWDYSKSLVDRKTWRFRKWIASFQLPSMEGSKMNGERLDTRAKMQRPKGSLKHNDWILQIRSQFLWLSSIACFYCWDYAIFHRICFWTILTSTNDLFRAKICWISSPVEQITNIRVKIFETFQSVWWDRPSIYWITMEQWLSLVRLFSWVESYFYQSVQLQVT